jgi:hypothetical protein
MGKVHNQQLPLVEATVDYSMTKEYAKISEILESNLISASLQISYHKKQEI